MNLRALLLTAVVCVLPSLGTAAEITIGNIDLLPDTADQMVMLFGSGDESPVTGFQFVIQVGDGVGPNLPTITNVDLQTGTVFENQAGVNFDPFPISDFAAFEAVTWNATDPLTLSDNMKIGTVTFDTTGINAPFQAQLIMKDIQGVDSTFLTSGGAEVLTNIPDGSISIGGGAVIPEPGSLALLGLAGIAAGGWGYRRRRRAA